MEKPVACQQHPEATQDLRREEVQRTGSFLAFPAGSPACPAPAGPHCPHRELTAYLLCLTGAPLVGGEFVFLSHNSRQQFFIFPQELF